GAEVGLEEVVEVRGAPLREEGVDQLQARLGATWEGGAELLLELPQGRIAGGGAGPGADPEDGTWVGGPVQEEEERRGGVVVGLAHGATVASNALASCGAAWVPRRGMARRGGPERAGGGDPARAQAGGSKIGEQGAGDRARGSQIG